MVRKKLSENCMDVAMKYLPSGWTYQYRKSLTGRCWRQRGHISAPKPVTRRALAIWLHECNHRHAYSKFPSYYAEYQCEMFAINTMKKEGIEVHEKTITDAKRYVKKRLEQEIRRGLVKEKISPEIAEWCGYLTPEIRVNPKATPEIKAKLQKCLALAASSNENESALAMAKAQDIMERYNIRTADVEDDNTVSLAKRDIRGDTKSRQQWESRLACVVAWAFDGHVVYCSDSEGWRAVFLASTTDLEIICDLFVRIRATAKRMSKAYVDTARADGSWYAPITLHNSYRRGLVETINTRLKALQKATRPKAEPVVSGPGNGRDLIAIKKNAVDDYYKELFPNLVKARRSRSNIDGVSFLAGQSDGKKISLHKSMPDGAAPLAIEAPN